MLANANLPSKKKRIRQAAGTDRIHGLLLRPPPKAAGTEVSVTQGVDEETPLPPVFQRQGR